MITKYFNWEKRLLKQLRTDQVTKLGLLKMIKIINKSYQNKNMSIAKLPKEILEQLCQENYYDPYDHSYYLQDYINDLCNRAEPFDDKTEDWRLEVIMKARRVVAVIIEANERIIVKAHQDEPFMEQHGNMTMKGLYSNFKFKVNYTTAKGIETKEYSIFYPLIGNTIITYGKIIYVPYHKGTYGFANNNMERKFFNTFPGFRAERLLDFDTNYENYFPLIQFFLDHIKYVWCDGNEKHYKWLISALSLPFRCPGKKTEKLFIIYGPERCGKGIFIEFLLEFVYGELLCSKLQGLEPITQKFNDHINGKLLIICDEVKDSDRGYDSHMEKLKHLISERTQHSEKKFKEGKSVKSYNNFGILTNHIDVIKLQIDQSRFQVFTCRDHIKIAADNKKAKIEFKANITKMLNQDVGNAVYSYFLSEHIKEFIIDLDDIEKTEATKLNELINRDPIEAFYDYYFHSTKAEVDDLTKEEACIQINLGTYIFGKIIFYDMFRYFCLNELGIEKNYIKSKNSFEGKFGSYVDKDFNSPLKKNREDINIKGQRYRSVGYIYTKKIEGVLKEPIPEFKPTFSDISKTPKPKLIPPRVPTKKIGRLERLEDLEDDTFGYE